MNKKEKRQIREVYRPTESMLTRSRQQGNTYAEGVFNYATVHLTLIPVALVVREVYNAGSYQRHINGLYNVIGGPVDILMTFFIIFLEFLVSFAVYVCFLAWISCYKAMGKTANILFISLLAVFILIYRSWLIVYLLDVNLPPAVRFTCSIQQLVLILKWVSFIYENAYKVLYPWHKEDETGPAVWYEGQMEPQIGSFSSYVYFLFCPVLLYRDKYPRKPRNFWKAFIYLLQFVFLVWVCYVILFEAGMPASMHQDDIRQVAVQNLFLGFPLLVCANKFIFHGWMNCWAELLGFADCSFYEDWWNTRDMQEYLRKWNKNIHEWLRAYLFKFFKTWFPKSLAIFLVLIVSAIEHDLNIAVGFGYFIPVYIVEYGICGVILSQKRKLNRWVDQMIMCFGLSVGFGIQMTLYVTEVAALTHCPDLQNASWFGGLRLIECYKRFNN